MRRRDTKPAGHRHDHPTHPTTQSTRQKPRHNSPNNEMTSRLGPLEKSGLGPTAPERTYTQINSIHLSAKSPRLAPTRTRRIIPNPSIETGIEKLVPSIVVDQHLALKIIELAGVQRLTGLRKLQSASPIDLHPTLKPSLHPFSPNRPTTRGGHRPEQALDPLPPSQRPSAESWAQPPRAMKYVTEAPDIPAPTSALRTHDASETPSTNTQRLPPQEPSPLPTQLTPLPNRTFTSHHDATGPCTLATTGTIAESGDEKTSLNQPHDSPKPP
ncbi:hypothetical protein PtA15_13A476 [Puccinia triticina]|uniref:Uncharacterized protein n=1 Tax=Puccinia triticina TaxID=208348 RepID=A0ABY7D1G9_9BASI|nr:uncharacterized protein PtA15_13A476 [Puccinia triticina]WAQ91075.1 hypothetical protein PtA15_13A476 [Puccinia triticina]